MENSEKPVHGMVFRSEAEAIAAVPTAELEKIIRKAGEIMLSVYGKINGLSVKVKPGDSNFVTETDVNIQRHLEKSLAELIPGVEFMAEEEGQDKNYIGNGFVFIIDPIDGTTNFMHDFAHSCVSVALMYDKMPVYGAIYDPYLNDFYSAVKGRGAFCNGRPISVADRPSNQCVVAVGTSPYDTETLGKRSCEIIYASLSKYADIRRLGSAALDIAYVSCGRCDGYCELKISPWDYSAGYVIAKEAGAVISDTDGEPLKFDKPTSVVFAAPGMYGGFLEIIKKTK